MRIAHLVRYVILFVSKTMNIEIVDNKNKEPLTRIAGDIIANSRVILFKKIRSAKLNLQRCVANALHILEFFTFRFYDDKN